MPTLGAFVGPRSLGMPRSVHCRHERTACSENPVARGSWSRQNGNGTFQCRADKLSLDRSHHHDGIADRAPGSDVQVGVALIAGEHHDVSLREAKAQAGGDEFELTRLAREVFERAARVRNADESSLRREPHSLDLHAGDLVRRERARSAVSRAKASGGRVVAAGTTVVRALEASALEHGGVLGAGPGEANLVLGPGDEPRIVDGVLTGMHSPGTSHFSLLTAFGPGSMLTLALEHAEAAGYLEHEFGDSFLVLGSKD